MHDALGSEGAASPSAAPTAPVDRLAVACGVATTTFGALCWNLVNAQISKLFVPFLASIVTLFPIGALFAVMLRTDPRSDTTAPARWARIFGGGIVGLFAAALGLLVAASLGMLGAGNTAGVVVSYFGWWYVLGVGYGCASTPRRPTSFQPFAGALIALVLFLGVSAGLGQWLRYKAWQYRDIPGAGCFRFPTLVDGMVNAMLLAPDVPATFWDAAQAERDRGKAVVGRPAETSDWGRAVAEKL
jgi:hypothetical protein